MVHPRGGSRGGRLSGLSRTIRSRARQDRRRNRGRCRRPAKTRGATGAEGDPGPARGRRVQRRCLGRRAQRPTPSGRDRGDRFPRPRRAPTRSATSPVTAAPPPHDCPPSADRGRAPGCPPDSGEGSAPANGIWPEIRVRTI